MKSADEILQYRRTMTASWVIVLAAFLCLPVQAQQNLQTYYRDGISLNGSWNYIVDPYENGYYNYRLDAFDRMENPPASAFFRDSKPQRPTDLIEYDFDRSPVMQVPGDWNTQDAKLYYYEGTVWYRKKFAKPAMAEGNRVFLYFGAVNYKAEVYLNGQKAGTHIGGFTPFYYEVTDMLQEGDNSLVVKVDNKRYKDAVPTVNTDWWNYGGITREVKLIVVPQVFVRDYAIRLESHVTREVRGTVVLDGAAGLTDVTLRIPELNISQRMQTGNDGRAAFALNVKSAVLWSPEHPKRYRVEISAGNDLLIDSVGFRTVSAAGQQILLNGAPVFLRGISVHEEYAAEGGGRVNAAWKAEQLVGWAMELNCNFMRLAHYPHSEDMVRVAERKGVMLWSEVPVYWTISWENAETYQNAQNQLGENVMRDRNRASVIIWSVANETPVVPERTAFLGRLVSYARSLDNSRLLSAALERHGKAGDPNVSVLEDPLAELLDVVSFNQYIGWYDGLPEKCDRTTFEIPYGKPVIVSEFGGGAKYGYHGDSLTRFTEEYQELLYQKSVVMLDKIPGLSGMTPWILVDFRSPRRVLPEIQDDFNRKGLYSEKGEKKKAFYVLQDYYTQKMKVQFTLP